jgi:hypothetical protein
VIDEEREKIIEKALKLRELANRGVGGEKSNAIRMLSDYKEKHSITDEDMNLFTSYGDSWYDNIPKEERGTKFAQWFRRSVAYDDYENKPMVFFHKSRTEEKFTEFDHNKGQKFYTENYGFHFVDRADMGMVQHIGNYFNFDRLIRGTEFYVYLRMLNPYYIYSRLDGNSYGQNGEQYRPIEINKGLSEHIMSLGFDSIIIQDEYGVNVYVVFNPNQIKSIDNDGEYSESNNIFC